MASRDAAPRPLLRDGALYWANKGCVICAKCTGQSALYTGRDISGQKVEGITLEEVRAWPDDLVVLRCASGCKALTAVAGPEGWPMAKSAVCPCWCVGRITDHDDRGRGLWPSPACGDDSDMDVGKPCTDCAGKEGAR